MNCINYLLKKCFELTKAENSFISLITPQTWLSIVQATKLRRLVLSKQELSEIIFLGKNVFEDASVDSVVFIINKNIQYKDINFLQSNNLLNESSENLKIQYSSIDKNTFAIPMNSNADSSKVSTKVYKNSITMEDIGKWSDGVKVVGAAKSFAFQENKFNETFYPMILGKDIKKYGLKWGGLYCCRDKESIEAHNATDIRLREEKMFLRDKILIRKTGNEIVATIDKNRFYYEQSLFSYGVNGDTKYNLESILGILNSKVADFLLKENAFSKKDTFPQIRLHWLKEFPLPKNNFSTELEEKVKEIQQSQEHLSCSIEQYTKYLQSQFKTEKLPKKLQNWHELDFGYFIKELSRAIKAAGGEKLSKMDEMEWMEVFETKKAEVQQLKNQIDKTDAEIDQMVYELYGLSEEEIKIVENS